MFQTLIVLSRLPDITLCWSLSRPSVSGRWTQATVQPSSRVTMMQSRVSVLTGTSTELYLVVWIGQSRFGTLHHTNVSKLWTGCPTKVILESSDVYKRMTG